MDSSEDVCKILVDTKCNLTDERQMTLEKGNAIAKKYGMQFLKVNSKNGTNVHEAFLELIK